MSLLRRALLQMASLFRARRLDLDLDAEIDSHLAHAADEYVRRGLSAEEARRRARLDIGGLGGAREQHRDARSLPTLDSIRQDVGYALRGFVRDPGFTTIAVLILALGIGANTAVFSVVNPLLLSPLPFRDAHELTWIADTGDGLSARTYRAAVFEEPRRHNRSFSEVSGYFAFFGYFSYKLTGRGDSEGLVGVPVVPRFFEVLGVPAAHGRHFSAEELQPKGPKAAVITHRLWQQRFAADPGLVGRSVTINGDPVRIVGSCQPTSTSAPCSPPVSTSISSSPRTCPRCARGANPVARRPAEARHLDRRRPRGAGRPDAAAAAGQPGVGCGQRPHHAAQGLRER